MFRMYTRKIFAFAFISTGKIWYAIVQYILTWSTIYFHVCPVNWSVIFVCVHKHMDYANYFCCVWLEKEIFSPFRGDKQMRDTSVCVSVTINTHTSIQWCYGVVLRKIGLCCCLVPSLCAVVCWIYPIVSCVLTICKHRRAHITAKDIVVF